MARSPGSGPTVEKLPGGVCLLCSAPWPTYPQAGRQGLGLASGVGKGFRKDILIIMMKTSKYMEGFFKQYRKWGTIALCCVVTLLFTITVIDSFVGFAFSKNMYMSNLLIY